MITYCLNMVISGGGKKNLQNLMTLGALDFFFWCVGNNHGSAPLRGRNQADDD